MQKLLEQTRLERNRRLWIRQQNLAVLKIQKCFRGRKVAAAEHSMVREQFYEFLRQLLFFFDARSVDDFSILVETCRLLHEFVRETGDIISLVGKLFIKTGISLSSGLHHRPDNKEVSAVGAACAFLHPTVNILLLERIMTILAYRTKLVPVSWNFMKRCHENQKWQSVSEQLAYLLPGDAPGWLLPLAVFCPVYKHMLTVVDNEEFYEQVKPLSLKDIRYLVIILRQALWQLLWVNPTAPSNSLKPVTSTSSKKHPVELFQHRVSTVASELLSQLQDWNNRREFTAPGDFHADGVNEFFITQAVREKTRANDIMKQSLFPSCTYATSTGSVKQLYATESTVVLSQSSRTGVLKGNDQPFAQWVLLRIFKEALYGWRSSPRPLSQLCDL